MNHFGFLGRKRSLVLGREVGLRQRKPELGRSRLRMGPQPRPQHRHSPGSLNKTFRSNFRPVQLLLSQMAFSCSVHNIGTHQDRYIKLLGQTLGSLNC